MGHATAAAHRGSSARRGTRGQRVAASIVVVGLVGAIALFSSGLLGHGTGTHPVPAVFPKPTPVSATSSVLTAIHVGRVTAWGLPEVASPRDVAVTADGVVWVTEQDTGKVDSFTDGTLTRHGTDVFPYLGAFSLGAGPDGAMWFSGYPGGSIARILPDGTANGFAPFSDGSATIAVAQADDGAMWVTDSRGAGLLRISSTGAVSAYPVTAPAGSPQGDVQPHDITRGADGTMWFTDPGTGAVGSIGTQNPPIITEHVIGNGAQPRSVAVAPDGSVWVTTRRELARVDPSTGTATLVKVGAGGVLNDLLVAPDGTLWVSEVGPYLLHVRPDGSAIERVKLPGGAQYADGIARADDGTIWAAATDANMIVSVAPRG